jgi:hypothetical protein
VKYIAWGASKLLELYLENNLSHGVVSCIDSYSLRTNISGVPVIRPDDVDFGNLNGYVIVVFAASSVALQAIFSILTRKGLRYQKDFILYSTLFYPGFVAKLKTSFGLETDSNTCSRYESFVLNTIKPHHTTVLGTVLLDSVVNQLNRESVSGAIAEVGAFEGGNALALLMLNPAVSDRRYYVMDSFEGFPEVSQLDPSAFGVGDYATHTPYEQILNSFSQFENVEIVKGFVPDSFGKLPRDVTFSLVFYDCDLYQPALDTFRFSWDKLNLGGYMVVHDYCAEAGGFEGVKAAVQEFFGMLHVPVVYFPENTMALIHKPLA